jgi:hypothetical protein
VTVHGKPINADGWSGYGYIVTDPETGNGAYLIEGNGNGGQLILMALGWVLAIIGGNAMIAGLFAAGIVALVVGFMVMTCAALGLIVLDSLSEAVEDFTVVFGVTASILAVMEYLKLIALSSVAGGVLLAITLFLALVVFSVWFADWLLERRSSV